jgi:inhibitor of KinA sporulation pathway (predicted exonuclease)
MFFPDRIIVVDLEATCWEDEKIPEGSSIDIIEIGVCNLNIQTSTITDKQSIYVIPERSLITDFCARLTGITPEIIAEKGISFSSACQKITDEYSPMGRAWASFGQFDQFQLQKQCTELNVKFPFGQTHLNIKSLFALKKKFTNAKGLTKALKIINEPFEGTHHCGADDAYNAAKILREILK